jgi:NADH dehydrogenase [ubiquinone] 1 alpha subcomplex assembly factor 2
MEAPQAAPAPLLQPANASSLGQDSKGVQADAGAKKIEDEVEKKDDPWAKAKARAPGETWQPSAWTPPAAKRR